METASVCLSEDHKNLGLSQNAAQRDHAAWLHPAIAALLKETGTGFGQLQAIAISEGPGSYTGLRVGMSAAKGLCYALRLPLLTVSTLRMMTEAIDAPASEILCPMIDARRMEVFTAMYNRKGEEVLPPANLILDENSFSAVLDKHTVSFFGNGSKKWKTICQHRQAQFPEVQAHAGHMIKLALAKYERKEFADLAYAEPYYGKDFYSVVK